jgi:hypothetical protein
MKQPNVISFKVKQFERARDLGEALFKTILEVCSARMVIFDLTKENICCWPLDPKPTAEFIGTVSAHRRELKKLAKKNLLAFSWNDGDEIMIMHVIPIADLDKMGTAAEEDTKPFQQGVMSIHKAKS